jgi:hypothetical protein
VEQVALCSALVAATAGVARAEVTVACAEVTVEPGVLFTASELAVILALRGAVAAAVLVVMVSPTAVALQLVALQLATRAIAGADLDAFRHRVIVARDAVEFAGTPRVALAALAGPVWSP